MFHLLFFLMGSTQQDFVQNERSKEEIQRDESLLVSSKKIANSKQKLSL